eukprot:6146107-Pyramimonas_sp.AAC.1
MPGAPRFQGCEPTRRATRCATQARNASGASRVVRLAAENHSVQCRSNAADLSDVRQFLAAPGAL